MTVNTAMIDSFPFFIVYPLIWICLGFMAIGLIIYGIQNEYINFKLPLQFFKEEILKINKPNKTKEK